MNVLPASLLAAMGMSLAYIPGTIASMSGAKPEETGLASGLVNTSYQIGSAIGLAFIVAVVAAKTDLLQLHSGTEQEVLNEGFRIAFKSAAVVSGIGALIAYFFIKTFK